MHIPLTDIRFCSRIPISGSKSENAIDELVVRWGNPRHISLMIGATVLPSSPTTSTFVHVSTHGTGDGRVSYLERAGTRKIGRGLKVPNRMCFVH